MISIAIIGLLVGFMLGLTGAGGGVLAVPLIGMLLGLDIHAAITLGLIGVAAIALAGVLLFAHRGEMPWRSAVPVSLAAMFGAPLGTLLAAQLNEVMLSVLFIALSVVTIIAMFRGGCHANALSAKVELSEDEQSGLNRWQTRILLTGFITGILAGCLGVGGGFLLVPALHYFGALSLSLAARISLAAIAMASLTALLSRVLSHEHIPYIAGGMMAVTGVWGLIHGQHLAGRLRPCRLKEIFASVLLIILCLMFVDNFIV